MADQVHWNQQDAPWRSVGVACVILLGMGLIYDD
ncbi:hypothetical protein SAMN06269250_4779 [Spirosoma fluviale]|uniref:Uncharacterized protein n=1 Tax=Spirosoma fluviale TaxID=1597977 RepID=A0A286GI55_9BACT|nr:hypothetical protein SAMN06269250_4779 [Spirosoma fluviale]